MNLIKVSEINKVVDLLKISKQNYYKKYFDENKKNCKTLWNGIHEIIYSKKAESNAPSLLVNEIKLLQTKNT